MAAVFSSPNPETSHENTNLSLYRNIMSYAIEDKNSELLAVIMSSWIEDHGALPGFLGLDTQEFQTLLNDYFPGFKINENIRKDQVCDSERLPEKDDLINLLNRYRANSTDSEKFVVNIVTAACMGSNHLWQDLGFWNREQLSKMIQVNFPVLAEKNNKNMKWKKFLYKRLCEEEGIYTCRSPSCEVCVDYTVCFGSEE